MKDLPEFFKVFLPARSSERLLLPYAYTVRYKGSLPIQVFLKNSRGRIWPVQLIKDGKNMYFQGSWAKFARDNSLRYGDVLIFKFDGYSIFDFKLLAIGTGCEKKVLPPIGIKKKVKEEDEEEKVVEEVEKKEKTLEVPISKKRGKKGLMENSNKFLKKAKIGLDGHEETSAFKYDGKRKNTKKVVTQSPITITKVEEKENEGKATMPNSRTKKGSRNAGKTSLDRHGGKVVADVGRSDKPEISKDDNENEIFKYGVIPRPIDPYFVAKIRAKRSNDLYIPKDVIRDHQLRLPETLKLIDEQGKTWKSKIRVWSDGRTWLYDGWRDFCHSNNLNDEDRCICEFKQGRDGFGIHMKVTILRVGSWLPTQT